MDGGRVERASSWLRQDAMLVIEYMAWCEWLSTVTFASDTATRDEMEQGRWRIVGVATFVSGMFGIVDKRTEAAASTSAWWVGRRVGQTLVLIRPSA